MLSADIYFWIVVFSAIVYTVILQVVRGKFVNMERMKEIQKRMNELNKQYFEALKKKDNKRMDSIQAEQNKVMPEFNGMMMGQLKFTGVVLIIFFSFIWIVGAFDPNTADDFQFELIKQGSGPWCGDIDFQNGTIGPWLIEVKGYSSGTQVSTNGAIVDYGVENPLFTPYVTVSGEQMNVSSGKKAYESGETGEVCVTSAAGMDKITATANSGTWFHVGLPFEIPFFNTRTLSGINIIFILIAIVGGLLLPKIMDVMKIKI